MTFPRKKKASALQEDCDWNNGIKRQEFGGHLQKSKRKSKARLMERIQPALLPATSATPIAAGPPATPRQYCAMQTTTLPYPALSKQVNRSADWQKVQCYSCGLTVHTKKFCPHRCGRPEPAGRNQPGSALTSGCLRSNSAQLG